MWSQVLFAARPHCCPQASLGVGADTSTALLQDGCELAGVCGPGRWGFGACCTLSQVLETLNTHWSPLGVSGGTGKGV